MKYNLSNIDSDELDEIIFKGAILNGLKCPEDDLSYSMDDVQTIFLMMIVRTSYLFPKDLLAYIDVIIKYHLGEISDEVRIEKRKQLDRSFNINQMPEPLYMRYMAIYQQFFTTKETIQSGLTDQYILVDDYLDYFKEIEDNICLDLDEICFSYYNDKKNKANTFQKLKPLIST
ncbi:hypothetical protein [Bartonella sp. HY038]|uniref:hypothetical protein n=1 Tax=Bartonella sp. HY038 TaxID=2759660 RepID=UPI0015F8743F|nr:hypothetical protein [Bartonella sp. HY038]